METFLYFAALVSGVILALGLLVAAVIFVWPILARLPEAVRFWQDRRELENILEGCESCDPRIRRPHIKMLDAFIEKHGQLRFESLSRRYIHGADNLLSFLFDFGPEIIELPHKKL